ncbi:hypothetical protein CTRI78_v005726 [Colletotrichum trifolii]|uniref:Uncharacterized protein n=1 Tax=Colletotrichum trifolii TaxID=5466 RepID=A0A4R8RIL8_COLTR|nr:hypothetical protein CTRI78_v005726 [Colletotrichum trifolii]
MALTWDLHRLPDPFSLEGFAHGESQEDASPNVHFNPLVENLFTIYTETAERSASTPPSDRHQSYEWDINVGNVYDAGAIITAKARGATGEIG